MEEQEKIPADACKGLRVSLVVPTYGNVDPMCAKDLRVAIMTAANHGVRWCGDGSPDRMGFGAGRNAAVQALLDEPIDGIMWVDSDIRMEPTSIILLLANALKFNAEFITGVYHLRGTPFSPVFYHYDPKDDIFRYFEDYPENVVAPIEGCGFGFVYTSMKAIKAVTDAPGFDEKSGWFPDVRHARFSEDLGFCRQAMVAGIQLYVHTGIQLGHTGHPNVIRRADYLAERERKKAEKEEKA